VSENLTAIVRNMNRDPRETFGKDSLTLLLLGCDEDLAPGGKKVLTKASRADMILLAKLDFVNRRISGVSVARDIRSQLPNDRAHKINAYHRLAPLGQGGEMTKRAVEHLLRNDVQIDRVIELDYEAFMAFIDLIHGVKVSTPIDLHYVDRAGGLYIDIPKGTHLLNGYDAMGYVRIRKNAGDDYMRQERQRQLLLAVKDQLRVHWTLMPQIIDAGARVLGDSVTPPELAALATFAKTVPKESVKLGQLPTRQGRGSFLELDLKKSRKELVKLGFLESKLAVRD